MPSGFNKAAQLRSNVFVEVLNFVDAQCIKYYGGIKFVAIFLVISYQYADVKSLFFSGPQERV